MPNTTTDSIAAKLQAAANASNGKLQSAQRPEGDTTHGIYLWRADHTKELIVTVDWSSGASKVTWAFKGASPAAVGLTPEDLSGLDQLIAALE